MPPLSCSGTSETPVRRGTKPGAGTPAVLPTRPRGQDRAGAAEPEKEQVVCDLGDEKGFDVVLEFSLLRLGLMSTFGAVRYPEILSGPVCSPAGLWL